ncbi:MAG TPA: FtsX-like permease family protein [Mycobacteriales bacterium]|nr:FtsX-like permease family protein [Mycobacteriales bacterium]
MIGVAVRVLRGAGRADRVRSALLVAGSALATGFALCGVVVLSIGGLDARTLGRSCATDHGVIVCVAGTGQPVAVRAYTSNLLNEPGLRPGVALAFWLLLIPVLVFLGQCARIAAARRDRRLAALRLAGATPGQVARIAATDTGVCCALGALAGLGGFLLLRAAVEAGHVAGTPRTLPTDVGLPVLETVAVVAAVPLLGVAASVLALRRVVATPLGLVRRRQVTAPAGWPAVLLAFGVAATALPTALLRQGHIRTVAPFVALVLAGVLLSVAGVLLSAAWLTGRCARLLARHTRRPAVLLAARRLERDPHGQTRATSAVLLCVLFAAGASVMRALTLDSVGSGNGDFYASAYDLVTAAVGIALAVAATGLVVANVEAVVERRRELAALVAAGTPRGTLRRALLAQSVLPAVPAVLVAALAGTGIGVALGAGAETGTHIPVLRLVVVAGVAVGSIGLATALTLPALNQSVHPGELRFE